MLAKTGSEEEEDDERFDSCSGAGRTHLWSSNLADWSLLMSSKSSDFDWFLVDGGGCECCCGGGDGGGGGVRGRCLDDLGGREADLTGLIIAEAAVPPSGGANGIK